MSFSPFTNSHILRDIEAFTVHLPIGEHVNRINIDDVSIRSVLGKGSFASVFKVNISRDSENDNDFSQVYALKCLNAKIITSEDMFLSGVQDLFCEAEILSRINHRNIIKLHGVSSQCVSQAYQYSNEIGYFIVLDALHETLEDRLKRWRKGTTPPNHIFRFRQNRRTNVNGIDERLEGVAIEVCHAMTYLHEKKIVYHDLKPGNIGFDASGTVKLFDFGLARYIDNDFEDGEVVGTFRYMAPEGMRGQFSGLPSDVYSFGILLWELCTLHRPFDHIKASRTEDFKNEVITKHTRPVLSRVSCRVTRKLIQSCWDPCPVERPQFSAIRTSLFDICSMRSETHKSNLVVSSKKLSRSFRKSGSWRKKCSMFKRRYSEDVSTTQKFETSEEFDVSIRCDEF